MAPRVMKSRSSPESQQHYYRGPGSPYTEVSLNPCLPYRFVCIKNKTMPLHILLELIFEQIDTASMDFKPMVCDERFYTVYSGKGEIVMTMLLVALPQVE